MEQKTIEVPKLRYLDDAVRFLADIKLHTTASGWKRVEFFYEKYRLLEAVEVQVSLQFPDRGGQVMGGLLTTLARLKLQAAEQLQMQLTALNEEAEASISPLPQRFCNQLRSELLKMRGIGRFIASYLYRDGAALTFYIQLADVGRANHVYISCHLGEKRFIKLAHEFELPPHVAKDPGQAVITVDDAVAAVRRLIKEEFGK